MGRGGIMLLILFFLPGYLLIRGRKISVFPASFILSILSSFALSSLIGLILLDLRIFDTFLLVILVLIASAVIGFSRRGALLSKGDAKTGHSSILTIEWLILLILLSAAAFCYFEPADTSLLSSDATIYFTAGVRIAQTGSLVFNESLIESLPARLKEKFFRVTGQTSDYHRFPGGFILQDPGKGKTVVSFQPLFPLWTAVFVTLFGMPGAFYLSPLLGVLSCLIFYLLVRKLLGGVSLSLFALAILVFCPVQIWFARYTMPEIMLQFLILGGLYARFLYEEGSTFSGFLSAILFGTALAAKFHAFIIVLFIILFCLFSILRGREKKDEPYFFIPLAVLVCLNIVHLFLYPNDYPPHLIIFLREMISLKSSISLWVYLIVLAVLISGFIIGRQRTMAFVSRFRQGLPALVALLAVYGLWIAPYSWNPMRFIFGFEPSYNTGNLARLAWYITPVVLAVLGCLILLRREHHISRGMRFFLWLALSYSIFFLFKGDAVCQHYWNARKYAPFILPGCAIFMAVALDWLRSVIHPRRYSGVITVIFGCWLVGSLIYLGGSLFRHQEGEGALAQTGRLAERFEGKPFILVQSKAEGWLLAQALTYLFDQPAVALPDRALNEFDLYALDQWISETGRTLYFVTPDSSVLKGIPSHAMTRFNPGGEFKFRVPLMERSSTHPPRKKVSLALTLGIYRPAYAGETEDNLFLDLGRNDFAYAAGGLYAPERIEKRMSRHTNGHGTVFIPALSPGKYIISACLTGDALPDKKRVLRVYFNHRFVKRIFLQDHFRTYHIPLKMLQKDPYLFHDSMELPLSGIRSDQWRIYPRDESLHLEIAEDVFIEGLGALRILSETRQRKASVLGQFIPIEGGSHVEAAVRVKTRRCVGAELLLTVFDEDGKKIKDIPAARRRKISRRGWFTAECAGRLPDEAVFIRPKLQIIGLRPPGSEALFDDLTIEMDRPFARFRRARIDFVSTASRPEGQDDRLLGPGIDWLIIKKSKTHHTPITSHRRKTGEAAR